MPDNDPLESLDNFPEGLHVDSLPASEVRRRGDRMRRRNTALATVGGVVAAAVFIGTPVALMSGNNDKDTVDPAPPPPTVTDGHRPRPSPSWLTEIPAEFPLADGFPETNGLDGSPTEVVDEPRPPVRRHRRVPDRRRSRPARWTPPASPTPARARTPRPPAAVLADDAAAVAPSLDEARAAGPGVPDRRPRDGEDIFESQLVDLDLGTEDSVVVAQQVRADDGLLSQLTVTEVAPSGNALFVETSYGSAGGRRTSSSFETQRLMERSAAPRRDVRVLGRPVLDVRGHTGPGELARRRPVEEGGRRHPGRLPARPRAFPEDDVETTAVGPGATVEARSSAHRPVRHPARGRPDGVVRAARRRGAPVPEFLDDPRAGHLRQRGRGDRRGRRGRGRGGRLPGDAGR